MGAWQGSACLWGAWDANAALITFVSYMLAVFVLAWLSNRLLRGREFMSEYFLGSRSLGMWAFALTFAATSASGGSFTGFPSKIYTHGWILGLWIASYMVVPLCAMGLLGKRLNQVARRSGSITIPDVVRDRFESRLLGLLAVALIVFFISFNLVAQFKSGAMILKTLLQGVGLFQQSVSAVGHVARGVDFLAGVDPAYLLCLMLFGLTVVAYTTYGGFHAVVWTDVMQGIVMVVGVVIMLPLALIEVGGLTRGTQTLARMTPPRLAMLRVEREEPLEAAVSVPSPWIALPRAGGGLPRLFRVSGNLIVHAGQAAVNFVRAVEVTGEEEIRDQLERLGARGEFQDLADALRPVREGGTAWLDRRLHAASRWKAQARVMIDREYAFGAGRQGMYVTGPGPVPGKLPKRPGAVRVTLPDLPATLRVLAPDGTQVAAREATATSEWFALDPGPHRLMVERAGRVRWDGKFEVVPDETIELEANWRMDEAAAAPAETGPPSLRGAGFLPLSLAVSFFFMWAISGAGQPSNMVRLMAFKDTVTYRRSMMTVAIYYSFIYFPLVIIFCCSRILLPGMELESDGVMPQMAVTLTSNIGHSWLAGLLVAAPFAAVMSTVDSFLLMVSSALVRDIFQRNIDPDISEKKIKWLSYLATLLVGLAAVIGAVNPPQFLQDIIVYTGSGLAACFLGPVVYAIYWPRSNLAGCMAGMLAGFGAHLAMYIVGWFVNGSFFAPYQIWNLDPIVVGLGVSFAAGFVVTLMTPPPPERLVAKYFYARPTTTTG